MTEAGLTEEFLFVLKERAGQLAKPKRPLMKEEGPPYDALGFCA